jgi:hypothetical protein
MNNTKKPSLLALIDKIDWMALPPTRGSNPLPAHAIAVSFVHSSKKATYVDQVRLRIGKDVINKLEWDYKDKIKIFLDPDNLLRFKLIKTNMNGDYSLLQESKSPNGVISFKWRYDLPLEHCKWTRINYVIHKDILVLDCNDKWIPTHEDQ